MHVPSLIKYEEFKHSKQISVWIPEHLIQGGLHEHVFDIES